MSDIETMRKELETAKRIRDNGYTCEGVKPYISCFGNKCPSNASKTCCFASKPAEWDAFISAREAELAAIDNTPQDGLSHVQTAPEAVETLQDAMPELFRAPDRIPTIDDFALALIQGGYYEYGNPDSLYEHSARLKAESDRRRA